MKIEFFIFFMVFCSILIGWSARGLFDERKVKIELKKCISWAIENKLLLVNTNKLIEIENSLKH